MTAQAEQRGPALRPVEIYEALCREAGPLLSQGLERQANGALDEVVARIKTGVQSGPWLEILRRARVVGRMAPDPSNPEVNLLDDRLSSAIMSNARTWPAELATLREAGRARPVVGEGGVFPDVGALLASVGEGALGEGLLDAITAGVRESLGAESWLHARLAAELRATWHVQILRAIWPLGTVDREELGRRLDPVLRQLARELSLGLERQIELPLLVSRRCGEAVGVWVARLDSAGAAQAARRQAEAEAEAARASQAAELAALQSRLASQEAAARRAGLLAGGALVVALAALGWGLMQGGGQGGADPAAVEALVAELRASEARTAERVDALACAAGWLACEDAATTDEARQRCVESFPACAVR